MWGALSLLVQASVATTQTVVQVNYGYFREPAGHLWSYGVDAHSWTDVEDNVTFRFTFWPQTSGGKAINKLQTGELDVTHLGNAPWGTGATRGIPAKMVYLIHSKDLSQVLVARQGLNSPLDVLRERGLRIAYIQGSTTHYMLQAFFAHTSVNAEDLGWVGHMDAQEQRDAWDKGEIDAGFMWGSNMRHLQENDWCSRPDLSSPNYRPCHAAGENQPGHSLFTAGMSRTWGAETWNNLVVRDAFLEKYPKAVARIVKIAATLDTKFVQDPSFLWKNNERLCQLAIAAGELCDGDGLGAVKSALHYDTWLEYAVQRSPAYLAERTPGACAKETIPSTTGLCHRETMSGSAWSTWSTAEFGFKLKLLPYLPSHKFYQDMMASEFVGVVHTAKDAFPEITAEALVANYTAALVLESNPAHSFCGDLPQPILLTQPGVFKDHEGGGFHQEGAQCEWHIEQSQPVLLSDIEVRVEAVQDNVFVYEGNCSKETCDSATHPLLARFTGGKGMSQFTMEELNPRPPIFVPGGSVTVVFAPDGTGDRPLGQIVDDGVSLRWSLAPGDQCAMPCRNGGTCVEGRCHCVGGWAGADCSSPSCMGTLQLKALADTPGTLLNGVPGLPSAHNADCRWVITTEQPGHVISVEIGKLDLDWTYDPLMFYDGDSIEALQLAMYSGYKPVKLGDEVGARCPGRSCPGAVVSSGRGLTVRWTSDGMQSGDGFELVFRSSSASSAVCGVGPVSACSGHGACAAAGCTCEEGWYGQFCQFPECDGRAEVLLAQGRIRNRGPDGLSYAPLRHCTWSVKAPADEKGRNAGAIAFWIEVFDLENAVAPPSGTDLSLSGDWLMVGERTFNASSPPCLATSPCFDAEGSEAVGCNCTAEVVRGAEAEVVFRTDLNNYPHGSVFKGFVLYYEAVYECARDDSDRCVPLDQCRGMDMVAGRTTCIPCKEGSVLRVRDVTGAYCQLCMPGRYQGYDTENTRVCETCPAGRYASSKGQVECEECQPGHFCSIGTDRMEPCGAGTFQAANGSHSCWRCQVGQYQENTGSTECVPCKSRTTTLVRAATKEEECVCDRGFAMGAPGGSPCGECPPVGVDCPGGGAPFALVTSLDDTPKLQRGYMVMEGHPWEVYYCQSDKILKWGDDYCPDGRSLYNASAMCGPGLAAEPQCAVCRPGYYDEDLKCKRCPDNNVWLMLGKAVGGGSLFVVFLVYLYHKSNHRNSTGMLAVMSLITFLQTVHLISRMDLVWQPPLSQILAGLSEVFSIPEIVNAMLSVEVHCMFQAGFVARFLAHVMLPLFVPMVYACIGVIGELIGRPLDRDKVINVVGKVFTGLMVSVSALAFSLFAASTMPNGKVMLKDYPHIELLSREWWYAMPIGILAVLVYCVAFLAGLVHVVIHAPRAISSNPNFTQRYLFVFGSTRPDCWWWVIPASFTAVCLNAVQALLSAVRNQLFLSAVVVALFSSLQTYVRPLKFRANNVVEDCLKLAYVLILVLASGFVDESRVAPEQRRAVLYSGTILILATMCCAALICLSVLARYLFWRCFRPPGTNLAHILETAFEFRHTALLAGALPNEDFARKAAALREYDLAYLEQARRVLVSCFFMEQPGKHLWQQRLIPGSEFVCFHHGKAFRKLRPTTQDGTLDAVMNDNLSHLLLLEQLFKELPSGVDSVELQNLCRSSERSLRSVVHGVHDKQQPVSCEVLISVVAAILPELTEEQANKLAALMDVDASGDVTPEEANATLQGLVSTMGSKVDCKKFQNVLMRVARCVEKEKFKVDEHARLGRRGSL